MPTNTLEEPTTEVAVVEKDEPELPANATTGDVNLVDRAARQVKEIIARTMSRGLEDVGNYLLETFYDGNPALYRSLRPWKHASLTMLEQRCETLDLPVSRTFLANAIGVAVMAKELPSSSPFLKLPPSHKLELLRVGAAETAETLATKALENKLTVQKLRDLVREERGKSKRKTSGRKPKPPVVRALASCTRLLNDEISGRLAFKKRDFAKLTPEQVDEVKALREVVLKRMADIEKMLNQ